MRTTPNGLGREDYRDYMGGPTHLHTYYYYNIISRSHYSAWVSNQPSEIYKECPPGFPAAHPEPIAMCLDSQFFLFNIILN